ncbi:MAG: cysteine--tRNA ligase [Gammaproteobacteria bacterium]|jgi:cysteinyl-tRNA synthetase|tara:strand:- start:301 stop:1665 length:1365 start_codon:yes stop_codon:yes gene_type:complete
MKIFNSLTKKKETFIPRVHKKIDLYVCGMTVYDDIHIGHARTFINFDAIIKFLRFAGWEVNYIRNITDIDDKIIEAAREAKISALDLSRKYINEMHKDFDSLGMMRPNKEPKVSDHINEIIEMIKTLENKGYAYSKEDSDVYFDVIKFKEYGKLSNRTLNQIESAERIDIDLNKNHEADFVLWKKDTLGITWPSPWGQGRPGWHIECSAMSMKYLGEEFDIHGGGLDLKFPHHENEIAQSRCATNKNFASYWMHTGPLRINDKKMSKSLKNFLTVKDVLKNFHPEVLRLFFLLTHYRSPISYSEEGLRKAKIILDKLYNLFENEKVIDRFSKDKTFIDNFFSSMEDDFNTPKAIQLIQNYAQSINQKGEINIEKLSNLKMILNSLGLLEDHPNNYFKYGSIDFLVDEIENFINERAEARKNKNFKLADKIRDDLLEKGILLEDLDGKTIWKKIS